MEPQENKPELKASEITETAPTPKPTPEPTPGLAPEPTPESTTLTSAPAESPAPAQAPTEPAVPAPTEPAVPTPAETPAITPAKKSKTPLIITIIVILLAACGTFLGFAIANNFWQPQEGSGQQGDSGSSSDQQAQYDMSAMSDFDLTFLRLENNSDNLVYSPLSIKYALAMLSDAAAGTSESQIKNLIGSYTPKSYTSSEHRSLANAMFVRESAKDGILSSYTDTLKQKYNASIVYEPFTSVDPINDWVSDKTFGIIEGIVTEDDITETTDFVLVNALAIDMNWNNQLQCAGDYENDNKNSVPCKFYAVHFPHESYSTYIDYMLDGRNQMEFNNKIVKGAEIGATANRYDIVKELGEDYIRATVLAAYDDWKVEYPDIADDSDFDIDEYMTQLDSNYGTLKNSTDFYFNDTDIAKVFAKDLQKYDNSTLQYVAIMPKTSSLSTFVKDLSVDALAGYISSIKDSAIISSFKDGVVTKITGHIPFFDFSYDLSLKNDLETLGVTDVFDKKAADLSKMTPLPESFIENALHKANIDFSNDGIRAGAATGIAGGLGAGGAFEYDWDVPVEEIDITFDNPFLFLIRDKDTGEIWFIGTVYNPAA